MKKVILKIISIILMGGIFGTSSNQVRSEEIESLITKICLKGFMAEMTLAGKTPPFTMGKFACDCFMKKISTGLDIESAQSICREETSKRFNI